jgi:Mg-chelatase subunit ChlD
LFSLVILMSSAGVGLSVASWQTPTQKGKPRPSEDQQGSDAIKVETNLVAVPVVASDRNDVYVADLRVEDFTLYEDGVKQEIVFFAATKEPFHVVLMLDTSASAQEKLGLIQRAATAFVAQLQPADRVKIMSFDDAVRELSPFTNDRTELENAIKQTRPGEGTKLYDAVQLALNNLALVKGRKAIVLFTDGVDWRSDRGTYDDNLASVEESGVIVYPIRYDTRAETEALVRRQQDQYGSATDIGLVLGGPPIGTTPPTVPGGGGTPAPQRSPGSKDDPYRLPVPPVIVRPPMGRYPDSNRYPDSGRYPDDRYPPRSPFPDNRYPPGGRSDDRFPPDTSGPSSRRGSYDTVSVLLDRLYGTADRYLADLSRVSGGKLHRADTLGSLPASFSQIAAELRQQYSLGYYPANAARDGKYRKILVKVSRKDVVVRARPGYRTPRER